MKLHNFDSMVGLKPFNNSFLVDKLWHKHVQNILVFRFMVGNQMVVFICMKFKHVYNDATITNRATCYSSYTEYQRMLINTYISYKFLQAVRFVTHAKVFTPFRQRLYYEKQTKKILHDYLTALGMTYALNYY